MAQWCVNYPICVTSYQLALTCTLVCFGCQTGVCVCCGYCACKKQALPPSSFLSSDRLRMQAQQCVHESADTLLNLQNIRSQYLAVLQNSAQLQDDFLEKLEQLLQKLFQSISNTQWVIIQCVESFGREQQNAIISGILNLSTLDYIEQCNTNMLQFHLLVAEDLKMFLLHVSVQLNMSVKMKLSNLLSEVNRLTQVLLQHALVVVEQPCSSILKHDPLTIISNAKFEVKLALLLDHQLVSKVYKNVPFLPQVDVRLLKEEEIRTAICEGLQVMLKEKPSFNILNKAEPMYSVESGRLVISIVCMLKVDINRRGHNPKALPVAEEKFKFIFFTKLAFMEQEFPLYVFSLPLNVLSRKDYRNSYATIIWDCAFAFENRQIFEIRESVSWSELASVLNCKFHKDVGVYLCSEHLDFIYTMIPNRNEANMVSWEQFAKVTLPMRQFTFFEWFYKTLILVRSELLKMYCDGLIHGFISSELSESLLLACVDGTFLIRFSETFCGAISVAYVKNRKFDKLYPWDLDRLRKISLSHTVKCSDFLLYLYPNVPKDDVFCKYYVHNETTRSITGKDYKCDTNIAQVINHGQGGAFMANLFAHDAAPFGVQPQD